MRYLITIFILLCSVLSFSQKKKAIDPFVKWQPVPHKAVNDFNKFLTAAERDTLEKEIAAYRAASGNAIVFISLDSLTEPKTKKQYTIEEAALLYFNTWGIGDSIKNNGVLLMVSRNPRRVRIEVGRGLVDILTDKVCQAIVDDKLVPNFKKGLFFTGIKEAVHDIKYHLDNPPGRAVEEPASVMYKDSADNSKRDIEWLPVIGGIGLSIFYLALAVVIFVWVKRNFGKVRSKLAGFGNSLSAIIFRRNSNTVNDSSGYDAGSNNDWSPNDNAAAAVSSFDSTPSSSPSIDSSPSCGGTSDGGGASGSW
jgi:uncharacterized protein